MLLQKLNNRKGFTLIELMIVIAVLAILAAFIVPFVANVVGTVDSDSVEIMTQAEEQALEEEVKTPKTEKEVKSESKGEKRL